MEQQNDLPATLDPPGSIAVIGAGPLGIEAALYARYLGYEVTVFEAQGVVSRLESMRGLPIRLTPSRSSSPLMQAALASQQPDVPSSHPTTIDDWIDEIWIPATETDLLRGRVECPAAITSIELVAVEADDETEEIPPDFRLNMESRSVISEAVIVAADQEEPFPFKTHFELPHEYYHEINSAADSTEESGFWMGLQEIVRIFATLGGRSELNLYRPLRG